MSVSTYSSLPRVNFRGIKDDSTVNLVIPPESVPIRLPLHMSLAPWGEEDQARYVDAAALQLLYGTEVTDPTSKFFTHQSQFIKSHLTAGGKSLFLGMRAPDATQANFRLALDIVADLIPLYKRNPDNSLLLDASGVKIPAGGTTPGFRGQWRLVAVPLATDGTSTFGSGAKAEGHLVSSIDGSTSFQYPVMDGLARFRGLKGSNTGFRLIAPTVASTDAADEVLQDSLGAFLYRLQIIERAAATSTATLKPTLNSASYIDFSFKQGTIDANTSTQYYVGKSIIPSYESKDPAAFTGFGPFQSLYVYDAQIHDLLTQLTAAETAHTGQAFADINLFNFVTGVDINNNPYSTFVIEGPALGGMLFSEMSNQFMIGGSDGTLSPAVFNTAVDTFLDNLDNTPVPIKSIARMPFDSVWDSGFPVSTKLKFSAFHNARPDIMVHVCCQDVSLPLNTAAQDSSIGVTLRSNFRSMQESAEFGTRALRFAIVPNAGYLINDPYDGLVPFLEYLSVLGTQYMGAEAGSMNSSYAFGRGEQNVISRYRDHNVTYRDDTVRNTDWNNGLILADFYDMSQLFWPGIQTIYEDQTSILHGYINACIACNLTRIGHIVWRQLSGDSQLDDNQFLDAVEKKVTALTNSPDRYDGRMDITPNAYYNPLDATLGTSWHLDIDMAGDNIRTTENLAIIAQRRRNEVTP